MHDGPTTKADCLNTLWRALLRADAQDGRVTAAVVLHDAEDVVHPLELRVFDDHLRDAALVQLPVVPLIEPRRRLVSGHYADEFADTNCSLMAYLRSVLAIPISGLVNTPVMTRDGTWFGQTRRTPLQYALA